MVVKCPYFTTRKLVERFIPEQRIFKWAWVSVPLAGQDQHHGDLLMLEIQFKITRNIKIEIKSLDVEMI